MAIERIEKTPEGDYRIIDVEVRPRAYLLTLRSQLNGLVKQAQENVDLVKNNLAKIDELLASEKGEALKTIPAGVLPEPRPDSEAESLAAAVTKK